MHLNFSSRCMNILTVRLNKSADREFMRSFSQNCIKNYLIINYVYKIIIIIINLVTIVCNIIYCKRTLYVKDKNSYNINNSLRHILRKEAIDCRIFFFHSETFILYVRVRFTICSHDIYICISFIVSLGKRLHADNIPQDSLYIQIALPCCPFRAKLHPERFDMREL